MANGNESKNLVGLLVGLLAISVAAIGAMAGHITTRGVMSTDLQEHYVPRLELDERFDAIHHQLDRIESAVSK